jgi:hypothetical protein
MGKRTEKVAKKSAGDSSKATTAPASPKQQKASKEDSAGKKKKKTDKGAAQPGSSDGPARAARRAGSASSPFDEDQEPKRAAANEDEDEEELAGFDMDEEDDGDNSESEQLTPELRKQLDVYYKTLFRDASKELGEPASFVQLHGDAGEDEDDDAKPLPTDMPSLFEKFYGGFFFKPSFFEAVDAVMEKLPMDDGYGRTGQTSHGNAIMQRYTTDVAKLAKEAKAVFEGDDVKERLKHFARVLALLIFMFDGPMGTYWLNDNEFEPEEPAQLAKDLFKLATEHFDKATDPKTQLGVVSFSVGPLRRFVEHEMKSVIEMLKDREEE